jgi:pimeloyl-ACP methyl ester carboxylesterase
MGFGRVRSLAVLLAIGVGLSACHSASESKPVPAPAGLPSFYAVPAGVSKKSPGTLLKSESVPVPGLRGGTARRVMYVSRDARGRSAAVTGLVFVPSSRAPAGGFPVVSWAHGTNGMAAKCAPSLNPRTVIDITILNTMLEVGWAVAATDYQGEGTPPRLLPFLVGEVAGRNTIDIVLAATRLPSANVGKRYVVWGYSEGGHSALFAWKLADTDGSRSGLRMLGVVAGAPPSYLYSIYPFLTSTPNRVYDYMMLAGFNAAYGNRDAPLDAVLTRRGTELLPGLRQACLEDVTSVVNAGPYDQLVKADPFALKNWKDLFTKNDPASFPSANNVPLLIVHGGSDEVIPVVTSDWLTDQLCSLGARVQRWVYTGQNHGGTLVVSALEVGYWVRERFTSTNPLSRFEPTDIARVQVRACR